MTQKQFKRSRGLKFAIMENKPRMEDSFPYACTQGILSPYPQRYAYV